MQLNAEQRRQFAEEGYLFLPECFAEAEVAVLRDEAEAIYAVDRPEVWREKTGAPRTAFAAHVYNEAFRLLGHHPRLIGPVEQAERLVVNMRGEGGARRAGLLAPDLGAVDGVDRFGLVAQHRDFRLGKALRQEEVAFLSELPPLFGIELHRDSFRRLPR